MRERNLSANASLGVEVSGTARLPAVPPSCLKDLRHGSKPCPVTNPTPREFFRNLFQPRRRSCRSPPYSRTKHASFFRQPSTEPRSSGRALSDDDLRNRPPLREFDRRLASAESSCSCLRPA